MPRLIASGESVRADPGRFRLARAGVLNVWQYDEQVFEFADGRLLLRGANGAGKSKTLEMLLPFVLDGDKARITASGRHHTNLLWLMLDGVEAQSRVGYVWVEFARTTDDGEREVFTCGIGIKASRSAQQAGCWYFTSPRSVGADLLLDDDGGPLSKERCRAAVDEDGHFFDAPRAYKHHVGQALFGLDPSRYDELLRLLYWLRQPQVGEDLEPSRLAQILSEALPELDQDAVRGVGETLDQLVHFGEELERRSRASEALTDFCATYAGYAGQVTAERGDTLLAAHRESQRRSREADRAEREGARLDGELSAAVVELNSTKERLSDSYARLRELEASPEARSQQVIQEKGRRARELDDAAGRAEAGAARAGDQASDRRRRTAADAAAVCAQAHAAAASAQELAPEIARCGLPASTALPAGLVEPRLSTRADSPALSSAVSEHVATLGGLRPAAGAALAAVKVVASALTAADDADRVRDTAERDAAQAEQQHEAAEGRRLEAQTGARAAEAAFGEQLAAWQSDPRGTPVDLPAELDRAAVEALAAAVRAATADALSAARAAERTAAVARAQAERSVAELRDRRTAIEAERDPSPPPPALARSPRIDEAGGPLWRLTDFQSGVPADVAARVEAALQAAGLLDAWVRADGALLDPATLDSVLAVGPPVDGASAADLLTPAVPDGCRVAPDVVTTVLRRVALVDDASAYAGPSVIGRDGSWRLGALTGRAVKETAQYVGAGARAGERARRLAEIDALLVGAVDELASARDAEDQAGQRRRGLEAWLADLPTAQPVLSAWTLLDVCTTAAARTELALQERHAVAARERARAVAARQALEALAGEHGLPTSADALEARRDDLRALLVHAERQETAALSLQAAIERWLRDLADTEAAESAAAEATAAAKHTRASAREASTEYNAARELLGADVLTWERALDDTRARLAVLQSADRSAQDRLDTLRVAVGAAGETVRSARERLAEQQPVLAAAAADLAALAGAPGLLAAALGRDLDAGELVAMEVARGQAGGGRLPATVVDAVSGLAAAARPAKPADGNAVYAGLQALQSGPAADAEPRVIEIARVLAVLARDDAGEHEVSVVARRLAAQVAADRELLTERERTLFENHLLGDLGECLRQRRIEATELVAAMNRLLDGVSSSQGVQARLGWDLRDDSPDDVRAVVRLLGQPLGALLPDERTRLRDALHRMIDSSRAEDPDLGYAEHLARALDYRTWSTFTVRITRPEKAGQWEVLGRKTPLSQGEQKIVCYLPLFAAAAAHFTSLAGAAPRAPRFVLLDDAFPKIDVRTHPLLFGLLVDLDLDFVVTSERLWGDHASVPSLSIYEALRSPTERGIAQYRHIWDGQRLQAVGG
jgi:uncharacterized protein (TIGR02680 family)